MKRIFATFLLSILLLFVGSQSIWASDLVRSESNIFKTSPVKKGSGKWRIAYYEGGQDDNYYNYLYATVQGLITLGWIADRQIPEFRAKDTQQLWEWLSKSAKSDTLEFVADEYYSARWDDDIRKFNRTKALSSLREAGKIDLMIAMGTWAGNDLANSSHSVPTIVMSTSDRVKSGIIKSADDSGYDHVHARVDPYRYERQVRIFHKIVGFKKLGVAYEDTVYGRSYAAIDLIEKVATERGFEVVKCHTKSDIADSELAGLSVAKCFEDLSSKVDAIYVTMQGGVNTHTIPQLVEIANTHRIPTFSQAGAKEVEYGFLLSISRPGFKSVGLFLAATIAKVLNGAKPRQLKQLFEETQNIAINLKTAELVGLYLYADILAAADEIYRDIIVPE